MANDFTHDPNCVALYRFESGALTVDSKENNTLTNNNGVAEDTDSADVMEGDCSALFSHSGNTYFSITDANLDSGFPCKSGETNRSFTICARIKPTLPSSDWIFLNKSTGSPTGNYHSFRITLFSSTKRIGLGLVRDGTNITDYFYNLTALDPDGSNEYFIALSHNAVDGAVRVRILNNSTGIEIGSDYTGTFEYTLNVSDASFFIGALGTSGYGFDGNIDEVVISNDVLSVTEIDQVWAGTYVYPEIVTTNTISFLYDIADEDSTVSCDNETSDFPIDYALEYNRPFKRLLTQDTTETTIELGYQSSIDTIFLGNCNFSSFKIEIDSIQVDCSTVMDKDSGIYNAFIRLGSAITSFKIIIPLQSTVNGESRFAIGAIVAAIRVDLSENPQYPLRKKLYEPVFEMRFDAQNKEVQELMAALGLKIGHEPNNLRYGEIHLYTDADVDGNSISGLLINFLGKFWPELFEKGMVKKVDTPLMVAKKGKQSLNFYTDSEFKEWENKQRSLSGWNIEYKKGLAALEDKEYEEIIRNPKTFTLVKDKDFNNTLETWFSNDSNPRKKKILGVKEIIKKSSKSLF